MGFRTTIRIAFCAAVLSIATVGPVTNASASDASIKSVINSYNSRVLIAEGHVLSAVGQYKKSGNPRTVRLALGHSIKVLSSLKTKLAHQAASSPRVKEGKARFEKGLEAVISAYKHLKRAYGESKTSPVAAKKQATKALKKVNKGQRQIKEGAKLLG